MNIRDEKAADLDGIVADIGEPVLWNGQTYAAIITSIESSETLQIGGFTEEYDFSVKIPKVNEALHFDGKAHRITRGSDSPSPTRWSHSPFRPNEHAHGTFGADQLARRVDQ